MYYVGYMFYIAYILQFHNPTGTLKCPNCGGGVVVRAENVDHPNTAFRVQDGPRSSTPITQAMVQNAPSMAPSSGKCWHLRINHNIFNFSRRWADIYILCGPGFVNLFYG